MKCCPAFCRKLRFMANTNTLSLGSAEPGQASTSICGDWTLHEFPVVTSTNLVARGLPAWNAVRAASQTKGRGRFQRNWVSDEGGLWLSGVVPLGNGAILRRALPLAVGLAVCGTLQELGISEFRLRWPNDVMVRDRKLAGLLIDQFAPDLAVVGIGINVNNRPESMDPELSNRTIRVADLLGRRVGLAQLTILLLRHVQQEVETLESTGASALFSRVNGFWRAPRMVELDLDGPVRKGMFNGVDSSGRLTLASPSGEQSFYDAHEVRHLTEIEEL